MIDAQARRLANMLNAVRPMQDGPDELVELYPADNDLIERAAQFLGITPAQAIARLITVYWNRDRRELVNRNMSKPWRGVDAEMVQVTVTAPKHWASYIDRWQVGKLGTWGTQMANGALSWWREMTTKTADESSIRAKLAEYLKEGGVPYHFDIMSEMDLGAVRNAEKQINPKGWPDLFIPVPKGGHHGLFIELKQDAPMLPAEHILSQAETGLALKRNGYAFEFAFGYDRAVRTIEHYLNGGH